MRALFLWLFLLLVVEVVVLYSMKKYAHSPRKESVFLVITLIGYATLGYLIVKILELQEYMGLFFVFRNIIIAIMAVGIGLFVFGEKVSPKQVFGIVLGIASLFLIAWTPSVMSEIIHNFVVVLPWLLAIVVLEQLSFVCAKNYAGGKSWCFLVLAGVVYASVGIVFALALKAHDNLGMMNLLWNILSTIFAFALGIIIFKEANLSTRKIIALVLGVVVLVLAV